MWRTTWRLGHSTGHHDPVYGLNVLQRRNRLPQWLNKTHQLMPMSPSRKSLVITPPKATITGPGFNVGAAVHRAVDDEVPDPVEEEAGPAAARRVPSGLLNALPVHALDALGIVVVVRDVGPRQIARGDITDAAHVL